MPEYSKHADAPSRQAQQPVRDQNTDDEPVKSVDEPSADDTPMTDAQAVTLKRLCEEASEPQAFDGELTKTQAKAAIADMRRKARSQH